MDGLAKRQVQAVLQAGGRGQRFGRYTQKIPKPLIPVGGVPMIERLIRQIAGIDITDFTLIIGYLGAQIERHVGTISDLPKETDFKFVQEDKPLGNFGSMAGFSGANVVLFAFADLVTDIDFAELIAVHAKNTAAVTLTSHVESYSVSLGEIVTDGNLVTAYNEKPVKDFTICSGMAVIDTDALSVLETGNPYGISDFINLAIAGGFRVEHWKHGSKFLDVNSEETLKTARKTYG